MLDRFTAIIDAFDDAAGADPRPDRRSHRAARSTTHRILDQLVRLRWLTQPGVATAWAPGRRPGARGIPGGRPALGGRAGAARLAPAYRRRGAPRRAGPGPHRAPGQARRPVGAAVPSVGSRVAAPGWPSASPPWPDCPGGGDGGGGAPDRLAARRGLVGRTAPPARRRVAVRQGDYAEPMVSVAATIGTRAAIGIVAPDRLSAQRYQPLIASAAARWPAPRRRPD